MTVKTKEQIEQQQRERPFKPRESFLTRLNNAVTEALKRAKEQKKQELREQVLPADFCAQVLANCREQGALIKDRIAWLEQEIDLVAGGIKEYQKKKFEACHLIQSTEYAYTGEITPQYRGDPLEKGSFELVPPSPAGRGVRLLSDEAMTIQNTRIRPMQIYEKKLVAELSMRNVQLRDLRLVARATMAGSMAVIRLLASTKKIEAGMALLGNLPEAAREAFEHVPIPCDPDGNPLPASVSSRAPRREIEV